MYTDVAKRTGICRFITGASSMRHGFVVGQVVVSLLLAAGAARSNETDSVALIHRHDASQRTRARLELEVGGELMLPTDTGRKKVPLSVVAELSYHEHPFP